MPDYVAYRKSISNELIDIKDRVRDLQMMFIGVKMVVIRKSF